MAFPPKMKRAFPHYSTDLNLDTDIFWKKTHWIQSPINMLKAQNSFSFFLATDITIKTTQKVQSEGGQIWT